MTNIWWSSSPCRILRILFVVVHIGTLPLSITSLLPEPPQLWSAQTLLEAWRCMVKGEKGGDMTWRYNDTKLLLSRDPKAQNSRPTDICELSWLTADTGKDQDMEPLDDVILSGSYFRFSLSKLDIMFSLSHLSSVLCLRQLPRGPFLTVNGGFLFLPERVSSEEIWKFDRIRSRHIAPAYRCVCISHHKAPRSSLYVQALSLSLRSRSSVYIPRMRHGFTKGYPT
jgi:hypothetical protein